MKRFAFTMIELVFVIVVIGILSAVIVPRMQRDSVHEAGIQLASHIRYTQHLAMVDDKFDPYDSDWYKSRWQINFSNGNDTYNMWSYTIFSDNTGGSAGNPDPDEIALNPLNAEKKLTGGSNGNAIIHSGDAEATSEMNLGRKYDIKDVQFSPSCTTPGGHPSKRIAFDHLGRPMYGAFHNYSSAYPANRILQSQCVISLCSVDDCASADSSKNEIVKITIEKETGYTHIL